MDFLKEILQEPEGKTSIKRVMLIAWFFVLVGVVIFSKLSLLMLYVFFGLLSQKAIEEISKNATGR